MLVIAYMTNDWEVYHDFVYLVDFAWIFTQDIFGGLCLKICLLPPNLTKKWGETRSCDGSLGERGAGSRVYMRAGSRSRNKEGKYFVVYYWVLFNQKHLSSKVLKFLFNIHQCLKENFGSKKMQVCTQAGKAALLPVNLEIPSIRFFITS